jgi:hypothetical protein
VVRATRASAVACARSSGSSASSGTIVGGSNTVSTTFSNNPSLDPKYRLTSIAVTPASAAISRTPTPLYPLRVNAVTADSRIA